MLNVFFRYPITLTCVPILFQNMSKMRVDLFDTVTSKSYRQNVLFSISDMSYYCSGCRHDLFVSFTLYFLQIIICNIILNYTLH